jgi:hypothetical protein
MEKKLSRVELPVQKKLVVDGVGKRKDDFFAQYRWTQSAGAKNRYIYIEYRIFLGTQ